MVNNQFGNLKMEHSQLVAFVSKLGRAEAFAPCRIHSDGCYSDINYNYVKACCVTLETLGFSSDWVYDVFREEFISCLEAQAKSI